MGSKRPALPFRSRGPLIAGNALLAGTLVLLHLGATAQAPEPFETGRLAALPREVDGWRGHDGKWGAETVTAIGAQDWLLRRYQEETGESVWLYVGFHSGVSFSGNSPHSPLLCYPGQGWTVLDSAIERIELADGASIPVNRLLVQRGSEQRLVVYWLQWGDEVTTEESGGDYFAKARWLLSLPFRVQGQERTDRSLVRVSARVELSPERTFATEAKFVKAVFPLLAEHFEILPEQAEEPGQLAEASLAIQHAWPQGLAPDPRTSPGQGPSLTADRPPQSRVETNR